VDIGLKLLLLGLIEDWSWILNRPHLLEYFFGLKNTDLLPFVVMLFCLPYPLTLLGLLLISFIVAYCYLLDRLLDAFAEGAWELISSIPLIGPPLMNCLAVVADVLILLPIRLASYLIINLSLELSALGFSDLAATFVLCGLSTALIIAVSLGIRLFVGIQVKYAAPCLLLTIAVAMQYDSIKENDVYDLSMIGTATMWVCVSIFAAWQERRQLVLLTEVQNSLQQDDDVENDGIGTGTGTGGAGRRYLGRRYGKERYRAYQEDGDQRLRVLTRSNRQILIFPSDECAICLAELQAPNNGTRPQPIEPSTSSGDSAVFSPISQSPREEEQLELLACGHVFHSGCIEEYFRLSSVSRCPTCRAPSGGVAVLIDTLFL